MASPLSFSSPAPSPPAPAIDTLDHKFGRKGIKFSESTVELTVRNGSSLKLGTSNAHVSSYKPKVYWKDDGFEEVLYTLPGSRGGIGFVLNDADGDASSSSGLEWTVHDVDSDSIDALQVELRSSRGSLDLTYVVSLYPESMATAVIVKNNGRKPIKLNTAILSHMRFKSRSGSGVQGLEGCSYCTHPPLSSPFEILSPREAMKPEEPQGWFNFGWEPEKKTGEWGVQEVPITVLRHKLSRVYAAAPQERGKAFHRSAPSKYEVIDQGLELMYRMIRMGFEEVYLSSPGSCSGSDSDRRHYFACTGPASILVPLTLQPNEEWRGAQIIEHDNL